MGIINFIKKFKENSLEEDWRNEGSDNLETREVAPTLKGDLVKTSKNLMTSVTRKDSVAYGSLNEDADNADVFFSFEVKRGNVWTCPECGTINDGKNNVCQVCGFNR